MTATPYVNLSVYCDRLQSSSEALIVGDPDYHPLLDLTFLLIFCRFETHSFVSNARVFLMNLCLFSLLKIGIYT